MKKLILLAIIVLTIVNIHANKCLRPAFSQNPSRSAPPWNITYAIFLGGNPEIGSENFSILQRRIEGLGFRLKNISNELTLESLEGVDVLILPTTTKLSDNELNVIKNYTLFGGDILILTPPNNVSEDVENLLNIFGVEVLGRVTDNQSYFENETNVILNGTWDKNMALFEGIDKILAVNSSALNYTGDLEILKYLNLSTEIRLNNQTNISVVYTYKLIWGNNNSRVEYKKKKYLYGENVSVCYVEEYWFGSRIIILAAAYVLEDEYVMLGEYDNLVFLDRLILWLGGQINDISITITAMSPNSTRIYLGDVDNISILFQVSLSDVMSNASLSNLTILCGFEFLGKFTHVVSPEPDVTEYNESQGTALFAYSVTYRVDELANGSRVLFFRVLAAMPYYGFRWSRALRIEFVKRPFTPMRFHPILISTILIVLLNLAMIVAIVPYHRQVKRVVRSMRKRVRK